MTDTHANDHEPEYQGTPLTWAPRIGAEEPFDPKFKNLLLEAIHSKERGNLERADECLAEARVIIEMARRLSGVA